MTKTGVSVVICCYNSEERLPATLAALAKQAGCECSCEVVLVDNKSTDNTAGRAIEIWRELGNPFPMRVETEPRAGTAYARRLGVRTARYDIVLFCDDDNHLCSSYIERGVKLLGVTNNVVALGGVGQPVYESQPPSWYSWCLRFLACVPQAEKDGRLSVGSTLYTAGMFVRRGVLLDLWSTEFEGLLSGRVGTKDLASGEDSEMTLLISLAGHDLAYSSELQFGHFIPGSRMRWEYIRKLRFAMGRANARLLPHRLLALQREKTLRASWLFQFTASLLRVVRYSLAAPVDVQSRIEGYYFLGRATELMRHPRLIRRGIRKLKAAKIRKTQQYD